ncbi:MAG: Gfo/Idh/MocA family oxidoreductase [bacterium]
MSDKGAVTRRDFVKRGAIATATVTAFNILPSPDARAQAPIRVAMIGCGGRGKGALKEVLNADKNVRFTVLADILPDRLEEAKQVLIQMDHPVDKIETFVGFKAYQEVVKADVDYVILTTPPCYRPEILEAAVEAKKNVFMEKPAAVDPPGIRRIIAAGEKAKSLGLSIAAGSQRRHQADYIETIKRLHDGAIGDIMNLQVFWCGGPIGFRPRTPNMTDLEWQIRNWYHFGWLSGDHIVEQHVHNIDVANWVMKTHPVKAYGCGGRAWQQRGDIWDHHAVHFEYPNGVSMLSMAGQHPRPEKFSRVEERVQGVKGQSNCRDWIKSGNREWKYDKDVTNPYVQEHIDLIASIRNNKPVNEAYNIATSTMTAIMGRIAEYTGREVTWDEAYNSNEKYPIYYSLENIEAAPVPIPGGEKYSEDAGWQPG